MDSSTKPAPLRFLAFSNSTLYHAQNGSDPDNRCGWGYAQNECREECTTRYYSALGARLVAGNEAAGEIGEIGFEWCGPRVSSSENAELERWEREITLIRYYRDSEGKPIWIKYKVDSYGREEEVINRPRIGAFRLLRDIRDAHHAIGYNPAPVPAVDPKYGYCQYFPPRATKDLTGPRSYKFDEQHAAIQLSCPIACLNDAFSSSASAAEAKQQPLEIPEPNKPGPIRPPHQQVGPLYVWDTQRGSLSLSFHEVAKACKKLDVIVTTNEQIKSIFDYEGNVKTTIPTLKSVVGGGGKKERTRVDIEAHAKALLELGLDQRTGTGTVVVLCGSIGCLVATIAPAAKKGKILGKDKAVTFNWLPPAYDEIFARAARGGYWMYDWKTRTMFAGALTYAMAKGDNALLAAKKGAVAMTFLLELVYWEWKETYDRELIGISNESWEKIRKRLQFEVSLYDLQPQYINGEEFWNQSTFAERFEAFETTLECPADTQELFAFLRKHSSQRPQGTVVS